MATEEKTKIFYAFRNGRQPSTMNDKNMYYFILYTQLYNLQTPPDKQPILQQKLHITLDNIRFRETVNVMYT